MSLHLLLIVGHIIGTILGVGGATMIEVHLNMKIGEEKKKVMAKDFLLTRIGMGIGFITGIGFILEYWMANQLWRLSDGVFWAKMAIFMIIIINAYLLHKHKIGLYWGSAFSFVSWWTVMLLGLFLTNGVKFFPGNVPVSFFSVIGVYAVCVVVGAQVLHLIRTALKGPTPPSAPTPPPSAPVQSA